MLNDTEVKKQYNEELKRWKKYEAFCESNKHNLEEIEKWVPQAQQITNTLSNLLNIMKQNSICYLESEVLHGFLI